LSIDSVKGPKNQIPSANPVTIVGQSKTSLEANHASTQKPKSPQGHPVQKGILEKIKDFFKHVLVNLGIVFGIPQVDDSHFKSLYNNLKSKTALSSRVTELFNKSQEYIDYVKKHGINNAPGALGVEMSRELQLLSGGTN